MRHRKTKALVTANVALVGPEGGSVATFPLTNFQHSLHCPAVPSACLSHLIPPSFRVRTLLQHCHVLLQSYPWSWSPFNLVIPAAPQISNLYHHNRTQSV